MGVLSCSAGLKSVCYLNFGLSVTHTHTLALVMDVKLGVFFLNGAHLQQADNM